MRPLWTNEASRDFDLLSHFTSTNEMKMKRSTSSFPKEYNCEFSPKITLSSFLLLAHTDIRSQSTPGFASVPSGQLSPSRFLLLRLKRNLRVRRTSPSSAHSSLSFCLPFLLAPGLLRRRERHRDYSHFAATCPLFACALTRNRTAVSSLALLPRASLPALAPRCRRRSARPTMLPALRRSSWSL
jgi:hypothetical protein